jgi:hypothetical protein
MTCRRGWRYCCLILSSQVCDCRGQGSVAFPDLDVPFAECLSLGVSNSVVGGVVIGRMNVCQDTAMMLFVVNGV